MSFLTDSGKKSEKVTLKNVKEIYWEYIKIIKTNTKYEKGWKYIGIKDNIRIYRKY